MNEVLYHCLSTTYLFVQYSSLIVITIFFFFIHVFTCMVMTFRFFTVPFFWACFVSPITASHTTCIRKEALESPIIRCLNGKVGQLPIMLLQVIIKFELTCCSQKIKKDFVRVIYDIILCISKNLFRKYQEISKYMIKNIIKQKIVQ